MDKERGEVIGEGEFESNYEGGLENGTGSYEWANIIRDLGGIARVYSADEVSRKSRCQRKKCDYRDAEDLFNNMRGGVLIKEIWLIQENFGFVIVDRDFNMERVYSGDVYNPEDMAIWSPYPQFIVGDCDELLFLSRRLWNNDMT
jgi:hypothetical protein